MGWLSRTFLKGLATVLPIGLSVALLVWMYRTAESVLKALLEEFLPDVPYVTGLGIAAAVTAVFAVGVVMHLGVANRLVAVIEGRIMTVPLLKSIYGALKDFLGFFAEDGMRRSLSRVVEVDVTGSGNRVLGFVTTEHPSVLGADDTRVAVYVPMSYQIGGFTYFVRPEDIRELDVGAEDALRFAMTAGVARSSSE